MKILALDLLAFGPFTDRTLDLGRGASALHVVYGPNEAGKSSALRGLKALLYGVPERTGDDFLHPKDQLRVGGRLCLAQGTELAVVRRKGRKNTLLDAAGQALDDGVLAPFLGGVGPELFETLFGIDHDALVRGGREILEEKGEVGQALFAAGLGTAELHKVLKELDEAAQNLFLARGSVPAINAALRAHRDALKAVKEASLAARDWDEHRKTLAGAARDLEQVEARRDQALAERNRLQRLRRALPLLASRRELQSSIVKRSDVVVLPEDFSSRRAAAQQELDRAREARTGAVGRQRGLAGEIEGIEVSQAILDQAETIEHLHQRVGSHRKAMADRPQREGERRQLEHDAADLLRALRPGVTVAQVDTLRPLVARGRQIQELGALHQTLAERKTQAGRRLRDIEQRRGAALEDLAALQSLASPAELRRVVDAARKAGDMDRQLDDLRMALESHELQCRNDLERLGLWRGELEAVERLPVPPAEAIERYDGEFQAAREQGRRLEERRDEARSEISELQRDIEAIRLAGEVPTEEDLTAARTRRDLGWVLVRRAWLNGEDVASEAAAFDAHRELPDAFASSVADADEVADRLRREADRVHKQADLLARHAERTRAVAALDAALAEHGRESLRRQEDWNRLWESCGLAPWAPAEMRAWSRRHDKLRERVERLRELREEVQRSAASVAAHCQALQAALRGVGEAPPAQAQRMEPLLRHAQEALSRLEESARKRDTLSQNAADLARDLEQARRDAQDVARELDAWQMSWRAAVSGLTPGPEPSPSQANDLVEGLREVLTKLDRAQGLQERIAGIDADARAFGDEVRVLVERVASDLAGVPPEQAVADLNGRLTRNRAAHTRREALVSQMRAAQKEIQEAEVVITNMEERLGALCREAGCATARELEEAETRSQAVVADREKLARLERELVDAAQGATLDALEQEAATADRDAIPGQIERLTRQIEDELEPQIKHLSEIIGGERRELSSMDGNARAAEAAAQAQEILARIRTDAGRYVRYRLASRILRQQIERYRSAHQGPLVQRASEHFAALTRGSFAGLRADFDEKDEPVLVGVRPDGGLVRVDGMSSGTRDQLYLALRLATLERYLESAEPLPFIVDDILVHFDDARSVATLKVLAELAARTQVILFTHHRRLVEEARRLESEVVVHELG